MCCSLTICRQKPACFVLSHRRIPRRRGSIVALRTPIETYESFTVVIQQLALLLCARRLRTVRNLVCLARGSGTYNMMSLSSSFSVLHARARLLARVRLAELKLEPKLRAQFPSIRPKSSFASPPCFNFLKINGSRCSIGLKRSMSSKRRNLSCCEHQHSSEPQEQRNYRHRHKVPPQPVKRQTAPGRERDRCRDRLPGAPKHVKHGRAWTGKGPL